MSSGPIKDVPEIIVLGSADVWQVVKCDNCGEAASMQTNLDNGVL